MTFIVCNCTRFDPRCPICRNARAAYRAGRRAYRQGRSRHAKHGHHGYAYRWTDGWYAAREANPNTAAARAKEAAALRAREVARLEQQKAEIERSIRKLSAQ